MFCISHCLSESGESVVFTLLPALVDVSILSSRSSALTERSRREGIREWIPRIVFARYTTLFICKVCVHSQ